MHPVGLRVRFSNNGNGVLIGTIINRDSTTRQYRLSYVIQGERRGKIFQKN